VATGDVDGDGDGSDHLASSTHARYAEATTVVIWTKNGSNASQIPI
jgi:hypothetical protein